MYGSCPNLANLCMFCCFSFNFLYFNMFQPKLPTVKTPDLFPCHQDLPIGPRRTPGAPPAPPKSWAPAAASTAVSRPAFCFWKTTSSICWRWSQVVIDHCFFWTCQLSLLMLNWYWRARAASNNWVFHYLTISGEELFAGQVQVRGFLCCTCTVQTCVEHLVTSQTLPLLHEMFHLWNIEYVLVSFPNAW